MSIICSSCGHENQEDASFCDECGEELINNNISSVEEETITSEPSFREVANNGEIDDEVEADTSLQSEVETAAIEEPSPASSSLPVGAVTRLEIDEPPIQKMASPPTTLELPELPTVVLINQETGEKFIVPSEEKIAYIGRINDEFPIQVDLSSIPNADLISRVHAAIHRENEVYYIEDAGSANGTWLNEKELQSGIRFRQQLNPGDTIAFGRNQTIKLTFDLED